MQKGRIVVRFTELPDFSYREDSEGANCCTISNIIFRTTIRPSYIFVQKGRIVVRRAANTQNCFSYNNLPLLPKESNLENLQKGPIVVRKAISLFVQQFAPSAYSCRRGELLYDEHCHLNFATLK